MSNQVKGGALFRLYAPAPQIPAQGVLGLRKAEVLAHAVIRFGRVRAGVVSGATDIKHFSLGRLHLPDIEPEAALKHRPR
ncbi:MAG: hypothetical protein AADX96_18515 [Thiocapsa sp. C3-sup]